MPLQAKYNIRRMLFRMEGRSQDNEMRLALAVGKDLRTIKNWQAIPKGHKSSINIENMYKMAQFFGCRVDDLCITETASKSSEINLQSVQSK